MLLRCDKIRDDVYLNQRRQGCSSGVLVSPSLIAPTIRSKLGPESRSGVQLSVRVFRIEPSSNCAEYRVTPRTDSRLRRLGMGQYCVCCPKLLLFGQVKHFLKHVNILLSQFLNLVWSMVTREIHLYNKQWKHRQKKIEYEYVSFVSCFVHTHADKFKYNRDQLQAQRWPSSFIKQIID